MTAVPKNLYHKRVVADTAAKQCDICYRPSTCVLITPDQSDWFYICPGHLKDRGFCSPTGDEGKAAATVKEGDAEKEKLEKEKEERRLQVIREYKEQMAKKKKEGKDKDKKDDKDKKKEEEPAKVKEKEEKKEEPKKEDEARVFVLHKKIFDRRVLLKRQALAAKRNQERMKTPGFWPSVPSGLP